MLPAMTAEMIIPGPEMADFSRPKTGAVFRVDDDVFDVMPVLPALDLLEFAELADKQTGTGLADAAGLFDRMFRLVLVDESAERFVARLSDRSNPIGIAQLNDIIVWVMEQVGLRPTEPSGSSSDGSTNPESGLNSTANAQRTVSTSVSYPFPVSSITSTGS